MLLFAAEDEDVVDDALRFADCCNDWSADFFGGIFY